MILSKNTTLIKDDLTHKEILLKSPLRDFNMAINYFKGDEDSVNISFKIKPLDSENWFYLSEVESNGVVTKRTINLSNPDSTVFFIDKIPQNKGCVIELDYAGDKIINAGDFEILIFTYKA